MLRTYYRIWVDAITLAQSSKTEHDNWKLLTIIPISILQGINLLTLLFVLRWFTDIPVLLPITLFSAKAFNGFLSIMLTFFIPFLILNYLLIFYNARYQELLHAYTDSKGKLYRNYFFITVGVIVIPVALKFIF